MLRELFVFCWIWFAPHPLAHTPNPVPCRSIENGKVLRFKGPYKSKMPMVYKILSKTLCLFCIFNVFSGNVPGYLSRDLFTFWCKATGHIVSYSLCVSLLTKHKRKENELVLCGLQKMNAGSVEHKSTGTDERFDFQNTDLESKFLRK